MAIITGAGGIYGTTNSTFITPFIEYDYSTDEATNITTLTATLYYGRTDKYRTEGTGTFTLNINGTLFVEKDKHLEIMETPVIAITATERIPHNEDGTKTVYIAASGSIPTTSLQTTNLSGYVDLPTVPRASTIYSASNVTLGEPCGVRWKPYSNNLYYRLKFSIGLFNLTTNVIHPNTKSLYFYDGTIIPLIAAKEIPNSITGTMTVTLYTYSNKEGTYQVGEGDSKTFLVTVPQNEQTIPYSTDIILSPVHNLGSTFDGLYIQGYSKVKVTSTDYGQLGATVVSKKIMVGGKSYGVENDYTSDLMGNYGDVQVKVILEDSRGITSINTLTVPVIPYSKPRIVPFDGETSTICARCDEDGNLSATGESLRFKLKSIYSPCEVNGEKKNSCALSYRYKVSSANEFSGWNYNRGEGDNLQDSFNFVAVGILSKSSAYIVQVRAICCVLALCPLWHGISVRIWLRRSASSCICTPKCPLWTV